MDQLDDEVGVITRHDHVDVLGKSDCTGDVGCSEVELRSVTGNECAVAATLFLGQNVDSSDELGVRCD